MIFYIFFTNLWMIEVFKIWVLFPDNWLSGNSYVTICFSAVGSTIQRLRQKEIFLTFRAYYTRIAGGSALFLRGYIRAPRSKHISRCKLSCDTNSPPPIAPLFNPQSIVTTSFEPTSSFFQPHYVTHSSSNISPPRNQRKPPPLTASVFK